MGADDYEIAPVSYSNFDLIEVRVIAADHKAIFARSPIPAGTLLGFFDGTAMVVKVGTKDTLDDYWWRQSVHLRLIGDELLCYVPRDTPDGVDFLNHSCRPNARVENQIFIFADRDIAPGEEITADYRNFNLISQGIRCWCPEPLCVI